MPKRDMNDLLKKRMSATQQAAEIVVGDEAYETLFRGAPAPEASRFCDLPIERLRPFFTADIGFRPYPPEKLKAFSQQLAEQGIYERVIVRPISGSNDYADIIEELKVRDEKRDTKLIRYSEAYRGLHYPVHLLSCDETGARQLQIMAVPDYRVKLAKLMLRSAYRPPPEDAPAWDAIYQNRPFVIGADMNLRRIDAAIASAKKRGCLPISLAALDAQGDAVLLRRYKDTGYAVIYKVTESVLTELFGRPPSLYLPPCTQYLTKKGAVVDAPLIQVDRKDRGSPRK